VFHHVRTVTLNNLHDVERLVWPEVMVGCSGVRRLFVLDSTDGGTLIYRVDPFNGHVELRWMVNSDIEAMNVTCNDQLLLTMSNRLELYDTDGRRLREIVTDIDPIQRLHESFLLPDSMATLLFSLVTVGALTRL